MQAATAFIVMITQSSVGALPSSGTVAGPGAGERATCEATGAVAGTAVVGEAVMELEGLGTVGTWVQIDLAGVQGIELYLDDRLIYALEVRYEDAIAVDEYIDTSGLSYADGARVLGAFVYESVAIFDHLSFAGSPVQRANWCKVGCGAAGGATGALVGAGVIAACTAVFKNPGVCRVVGAAIGGAVAGAVEEACEQFLCD